MNINSNWRAYLLVRDVPLRLCLQQQPHDGQRLLACCVHERGAAVQVVLLVEQSLLFERSELLGVLEQHVDRLDLAVPRDIDPAAGELEDIYLYSVDDLQSVIDDNRRSREKAATLADGMLDGRIEEYIDWLDSRQAIDTIRDLRHQAYAAREDVLAKARRRLARGPQVRRGRDPLVRARDRPERERGPRRARAVGGEAEARSRALLGTTATSGTSASGRTARSTARAR